MDHSNKIIKIGILVGFLIALGGHVFSDDIHLFALKGDLEGVKAQIKLNPELVNAKDKNGRWTAPRFAPFPGDGEGDVPFFAPDGKRVYFMSAIAPPEDPQSQKERIWYVDRSAEGWSKPKVVDASVNDYPHHWQFSADADHTLYFSSSVPDGYGEGDIYYSKLEGGKWQKPENLGPPVNTKIGEGMPFIAPDGSYLLFSRSYNLYISYRDEDGKWIEPINLGKPINSPSIDICPMVTPDGKYLFFLSQWGGESHIWWVDAGFIKKLKR